MNEGLEKLRGIKCLSGIATGGEESSQWVRTVSDKKVGGVVQDNNEGQLYDWGGGSGAEKGNKEQDSGTN